MSDWTPPSYPLVRWDERSNEPLWNMNNWPEHLVRTQLAFEGQLVHLADCIKQLPTHPHFSDDCGDYLFSALDLATQLQLARMDGVHDLYDKFLSLTETSPSHDSTFDDQQNRDWMDGTVLLNDFAGDGISAMVFNHCRWLREQHLKDRFYDPEPQGPTNV